MKSHNIEDLPFPVGHALTEAEMDVLIVYNQHDVKETLKFFNHSLDQIRFRQQLTEKYNHDFMNHNDGKIGKDYFQMQLQGLVSNYTRWLVVKNIATDTKINHKCQRLFVQLL